MARLNTRPSHLSTASTSRYNSPTPQLHGGTSDQENADPALRKSMDKANARVRDLPARPSKSDEQASRGHKRRRDALQPLVDDIDEEEEGIAARFTKYFDPDQDPEERRRVTKKCRELERDFHENRDAFLRDDGSGMKDALKQMNRNFKDVKQTTDASRDSKLLVHLSAVAKKKATDLNLGDHSTGIDVDEFFSKCITYMRNSGPLARDDARPTQNRRRTTRGDEDDDVAEEALDLEYLGRHACFPHNSRPPTGSFLLGPLSVEKRQRMQTQRRARQEKDTTTREARPEALTRSDLNQGDEKGLVTICNGIHKQLKKHCAQVSQTLESAGFTSVEQLHTREGQSMMKKHRIADTGGVSLFDFVLNPRSFGQTIENLFYVSFLIKEGSFGIQNDSRDLPTIISSGETRGTDKSVKHQAVFSLDYGLWESLVEAFDVRNAMIPHRNDEAQAGVGARGWYG